MRIERIRLRSFKRFTDLEVGPIPRAARLVVLVGPNGSGKSSLLEGFNHWHALRGWGNVGDQRYLLKDNEAEMGSWHTEVVTVNIHDVDPADRNVKDKFYFRTAYRNEPDFSIGGLQRIASPTEHARVDRFIVNEASVSQNYQRLVGRTLGGVYDDANNNKLVSDLRNELVGKVRASLSYVFDDLTLSSIGDPLSNGAFYFQKGKSSAFHYKNLSAGEKSVFDLILDLVVNSNHYPDAIFFIDEPEAHIHTEKQASALRALYNLIPEQGQLWCSTHSLGMLVEAQRIEQETPGSVVFLDFSDRDYDLVQKIVPSRPDRQLWDKTLELTLGNLAFLVGPNTIYLCEGDPLSRKNKSFDAQVLERIFSSDWPQASFISIGSADDVTNPNSTVVKALEAIFPRAEIKRLIDRDYLSEEEVQELRGRGVRVTSERHLEAYLLSDEIIEKLCITRGRDDVIPAALQAKQDGIARSCAQGKDANDIKSAAGFIVNDLRTLLQIQNGGSSTHPFLRDTIAPLVTWETGTYARLAADLA